ncbi:hypothetical protein ACLB2K_060515 [Fragaria x ananassa]
MAHKLSNEAVLEQLKNGFAQFELVSSPLLSISASISQRNATPFSGDHSHRFFARIGPPLGRGSSAMRKVERYSVQRVTGDGRCLFRALVKGMAANKGSPLSPREEKDNADELRMAVKEVICENEEERLQYEAALVAITVDESLKRYCQRIQQPDFWGGESELLVLSKLCRQPIIVYIPEHEHTNGGRSSGFIPIAEYGSEFSKGSRNRKPRKAVRLLFSGRNHYDLLLKHGFAHFEIVSSPVLSISTSIYSPAKPVVFFGDYSRHRFFAKTEPLLGRGSPAAIREAETYSVRRVDQDGQCLFRAVVKGMAANDGSTLSQREEKKHELRRAVKDFICSEYEKQHPQYEAARKAIVGKFDRYCERITKPNFQGGKSELLALSQVYKLPIIVYIPAPKHPNGFIPIQEYGTEFGEAWRGRKAVRLLLKGSNHYDLLV